MGVSIKYFGVSAFELVTESKARLLIDPYLGDNPWSPVKPADLGPVDAVLVTHAAFDHLGDAFDILERDEQSILVCGDDVKTEALRRGIPEGRVRRINPFGRVVRLPSGVSTRGVEARHPSRITKGNEYLPGWALGLVVCTEGGVRLYHTGDTALFGDIKLIGWFYRPNILMINIGALPGHEPIITPFQAAEAVTWVNPDVVIPMHYDPQTDVLDRFVYCVREAAPHVQTVALNPGDWVKFEPFRMTIESPCNPHP